MFNRILVLFVKVRMPSAPCRLYVASAFDGQCRYSVKASEKTVYNKEKWTTKNSWHFTSKKIKPTSNTTKFLYP